MSKATGKLLTSFFQCLPGFLGSRNFLSIFRLGSCKLSFVIYILVLCPARRFYCINLFFLSHFYRAILVYLIPVKMLLVRVRNVCIKQGTGYLEENLHYLMVESTISASIKEFDPKYYTL